MRTASRPVVPYPTVVEFTIPVRTISEANSRDHWAVRARRAHDQRTGAFYQTRQECRFVALTPPFRITLTRFGARRLDVDNLANSMKHVQDGIADALNIDDGDERIEWRYEQERGDYSVRVKIEEARK